MNNYPHVACGIMVHVIKPIDDQWEIAFSSSSSATSHITFRETPLSK